MASDNWVRTAEGSNSKKFSHPLHATSLLNQLNEGRKNAALCDGILLIGGEEIPVQKNILSAASPYFRFISVRRLYLFFVKSSS